MMRLHIPKKRHTPKDDLEYIIPLQAIKDTEKILKVYGSIEPSNEGLVYWAGTRDESLVKISLVIAPKTDSDYGSITTSNRSNFDVVKIFSESKTVHIGQVHSHPGDWIDHSPGDDEYASFKTEGLLSVVVPNYCQNSFLPMTNCGFHRYHNGKFIRFSDNYVLNHFRIDDTKKSDFIDLRN